MSFKSSLKTLRIVAAEAGPSTTRTITTSAPACISAQSRKIPAAKRENGEDMNPREWAEQLRNVREWKSKQESIRQQTSSVRPPTYSSLAAKSSDPSDTTSTSPHAHLLSQLMASTAHLGHIPSSLSPAYIPYIHSRRANIHLIDLEQTVPLLQRASEFVRKTVERDGSVLFVGTRKGHRGMVRKAVERLEGNGFGVAGERWMPGTLTNSLSYFGPKPIRAGSHLPDIVVVLNPSENLALIKECNISNIPTIGIVDTDTDPRIVTYAIPANMESMRTAELIVATISLAGQAGREKRLRNSASSRSRR